MTSRNIVITNRTNLLLLNKTVLFQKNSFKDKIRKNDSLLLTEILKENFTKSGKMEFFEDAQKLLKNNFLKSLGDWKKLSEEEKKIFPVGLKILLNDLTSNYFEILKF
jgi:hypothetical protein